MHTPRDPARAASGPRRLAPLAVLVLLASGAGGQEDPAGPTPGGPPAPPRGEARQAMWPAPTAADWKKPCLLTWQRTWDDAVAVAKETGRPILVCINMDGEIASEHYAGVRYRQPEIAALYEPYVLVIASVYRHSPRDYDDEGRRIPCPRFGGVTCGEHIDIEPLIFEKFCDGQRVAPRHICVELDGKESYDVYYRNDTASVFEDIRKGIAERPPLPPNVVRSDRPVLERVGSRDVRDRTAVERAYGEGDPDRRRALLEAALKQGGDAQLELLRLAVFGLDLDQSRLARQALAGAQTPDATRLIADALRVPMDPADRDALLTALKRLGETSPLARYLSVVHHGLTAGSAVLDAKDWSAGGGTYPAASPWHRSTGLEAHIESKAEASEAKPEDPTVRLDLAEASLALGVKAPEIYHDPRTARFLQRHLYEDARRSALEAEKLGAEGWRLHTVLALAAYYQGELADAYVQAEKAVKVLPPGEPGWSSMAVVTVYAESRWKAIKEAVRENKTWPPEYLTDLHAAYSVLLRHPLGTDGQVAWHYDLLDWLGADYRSERVLRLGIARFTTSAALHERLRDKVLKLRGPDALEAAYAELAKDDAEALAPFSAAASVAVAEHHRRTGGFAKALEAYERAIAHYGRAVPGEETDAAVALARAGRARVAYELGDDARALEEVLLSFEKSPGAAGTRDAMGITPGETAQMLLARLKTAAKGDLAARLEKALATIDPDLLRPEEE